MLIDSFAYSVFISVLAITVKFLAIFSVLGTG